MYPAGMRPAAPRGGPIGPFSRAAALPATALRAPLSAGLA